jgi:hypothetical protein
VLGVYVCVWSLCVLGVYMCARSIGDFPSVSTNVPLHFGTVPIV